MSQYQNTLTYAAAGAVIGQYVLKWSPADRVSAAMFWGLMGAGAGYALDSGNTDWWPKRKDNPTFNYTQPYQGQGS